MEDLEDETSVGERVGRLQSWRVATGYVEDTDEARHGAGRERGEPDGGERGIEGDSDGDEVGGVDEDGGGPKQRRERENWGKERGRDGRKELAL